ncbi:hypothetical protein N9Y42_10225 [Mariniblastus sp.]|nr:hypothetical protein [Mariniblastus sp.]
MNEENLVSTSLLQSVVSLLNSREHVSDADAMTTEKNNVHVRFRCRSLDALEEILACVNGANAGHLVVVSPDFRSRYDSDSNSGMWFFLDIANDRTDGWTKLEVFEQMLK